LRKNVGAFLVNDRLDGNAWFDWPCAVVFNSETEVVVSCLFLCFVVLAGITHFLICLHLGRYGIALGRYGIDELFILAAFFSVNAIVRLKNNSINQERCEDHGNAQHDHVVMRVNSEAESKRKQQKKSGSKY
jgi:hypothetical protein